MKLVEVRDLDGPNVFLLQPAIKLELAAAADDLTADAVGAFEARLEPLGISDEGWTGGPGELGALIAEAVGALHTRLGLDPPEMAWAELDTPGHLAVAFGWSRRAFALRAAQVVADLAVGTPVQLAARLKELKGLLAAECGPDDAPQMVTDAERRMPIVGITGTNGKTTTTRLVSHVLTRAGRRVGWSSSSGVYIAGTQVIEGDYTGLGGARRVLDDPSVDVAVLETARGGILLRGLGYESNDVGVFLNVSGDHLGLHGVTSLDSLARVKATVVRVTRPDGWAVLNADDPFVRGVAGSLRASPFWVSQAADNRTVVAHTAAGGRAIFVRDGVVVAAKGAKEVAVVPVAEVPIAFGGRARHMVENALCAAAACLALGLPVGVVRDGLASFRPSAEDNSGRLNVYEVEGVTVILDFAHNEAGLVNLLALARSFAAEGGRVIAVIGTAGDRTDENLRALGRLAGAGSDHVVVKETIKYLRGRSAPAEMNALFEEGIRAGGGASYEISPGEVEGVVAALSGADTGDVVAVMCIEQGEEVRRRLLERGRAIT